MKSDWLLGAIEAITNADDAYGDADGDILIEVRQLQGKSWSWSVRDRASGIPGDVMEEKLLSIGGRTSGHERGRFVRGNRGRGAKDLSAFGAVRWDSIVDGKYSWLELNRTGTAQRLKRPITATPAIRHELGLTRGNGTVVTVTCNNLTRQRADTMKYRLEQCVALRDIMQDSRRHIKLLYGSNKAVTLQYDPPANLIEVENIRVAVPGYSGEAHVVIQEASQPFKDTASDPCRDGGLLVKSGRAIHEATLFSYESDPFASYFTGEVRWDTIDELSRNFDAREEGGLPPTDDNPHSIISRNRTGLDRNHPAWIALRKVVDSLLAKHVARKRQEDAKVGHESLETRKRLNDLARIIARFREEKEEELEEVDDEGTDWVPGDEALPEFAIVPPRKRIAFDKTATFTVQLYRESLAGEEPPKVNLTIACQPDDAASLSTTSVQLREVEKSPGLFKGTFRVTGGANEGSALIEAITDDGLDTFTAEVFVREPIAKPTRDLPETFMFEKPRYSIPPGKKKVLRLLAPSALVETHGLRLKVEHPKEAGILIRHFTIDFKKAEDGEYYEALLPVEGRQFGAEVRLVARYGELIAEAQVSVIREHEGPQINIHIGQIPGYQRARWEREGNGDITITVNGVHPAAKRYMGPAPDFPLKDSVSARIMIAEVVAEEAVREFLTRKHSGGFVDVTAFYADRNKELMTLLPRCHASQLADADVAEFTANERSASSNRRPIIEPGQIPLDLAG
jgi:hypothetical protein